MPPKRVHANDGGAGTGKKKGASAPAYTAALQLALGYSTLEQPNDAAAQPLTKGDLTNFVTGGVHSLFNEKLTSAQATQVIGTQLLKELNRDAGLAGGAAEAQTPGGALVPATPATAPGLGAAPSQLYKWTAPTAGGKQKKGGALSHVLHRGDTPVLWKTLTPSRDADAMLALLKKRAGWHEREAATLSEGDYQSFVAEGKRLVEEAAAAKHDKGDDDNSDEEEGDGTDGAVKQKLHETKARLREQELRLADLEAQLTVAQDQSTARAEVTYDNTETPDASTQASIWFHGPPDDESLRAIATAAGGDPEPEGRNVAVEIKTGFGKSADGVSTKSIIRVQLTYQCLPRELDEGTVFKKVQVFTVKLACCAVRNRYTTKKWHPRSGLWELVFELEQVDDTFVGSQ